MREIGGRREEQGERERRRRISEPLVVDDLQAKSSLDERDTALESSRHEEPVEKDV